MSTVNALVQKIEIVIGRELSGDERYALSAMFEGEILAIKRQIVKEIDRIFFETAYIQ